MAQGTCAAEDCDRPAALRGWCRPHYMHWWKTNRTLPTCSVDGCDKPGESRGWCPMHWRRWRMNGDPLIVRLDRSPDWTVRFWAKVDKDSPGGCWLWTARCNDDGYGQFTVPGGGQQLSHRLAFTLLVGPIPEGHVIDHVKVNGCTSKACVKPIADEHGPAHLEPVTHRENVLRGDGTTGRNARKTHCPQGHPYDEVNTYLRPDGHGRECLACRRVRQLIRRPLPPIPPRPSREAR
jgi:HNH endonuclease